MIPPRLISEENLEILLKSMTQGMHITRGNFNFRADCSVEDLDWNHMDQEHRPFIHRTYQKALRIYTSENAALSLTELPFIFFKFLVLVQDFKIRTGLFYQCYSLFSLIYVHGILENHEEGMQYRWYIASSKWLAFLHRPLSRRIYRLNEVQINEDVPLRTARKKLRECGYDFPPNDRDFISANDGKMHTVYPPYTGPAEIDLTSVTTDRPVRHESTGADILILQEKPGRYRVWRTHCPHEGASLEGAEMCKNKELVCPWHGLKFKGAALSPEQSEVTYLGLHFILKGETLIVSAATSENPHPGT